MRNDDHRDPLVQPVQSVDRAAEILEILARRGDAGVTEVCAELAADLGETVNVAVLDEGAAMNVSQARGSAAVAVQNWVGRRTPLHATSSGKVLLAFAPDDVRRRLVAQ